MLNLRGRAFPRYVFSIIGRCSFSPVRHSTCVSALAVIVASACGEQRSVEQPDGATLVPDQVQCRDCAIVMDTIATLLVPGDSTDGFPLHVRSDRRGRYWLFRQGELPMVFESSGLFLRALGRKGRGPGEYMWAYDLIAAGQDSVLVIDTDERRATLLDSSLTPVSYTAIPGPIRSGVVLSWPELVAVNAGISTPDAVGWPLHFLSFGTNEAVLIKSFGVGEGEVRQTMDPRHELAPSRSGFWVSATYVYELSLWSWDGLLLQHLRRRPTWFGFDDPPGWDWRVQPPNPHVVALSEDSLGLVWVAIGSAGPDWKSAFAKVPPGTLEYSARQVATEQLWSRTIIEVIDPTAKRVVTRQTVTGHAISSVNPQRIAFYDVDELGRSKITVIGLRLTGR